MLREFAKTLLRRRLKTPTAKESQRTEALRNRISAMPALEAQPEAPASIVEWTRNRTRLRWLIMNDDPRRFLEWDVIRHTMFIGSASFVREELACLRASPEWRRRWRPALAEDAFGLPQRCRYDVRSSGNLIHHAYSLRMFERAVGSAIDRFPCILEFGGGYGSFCRLTHRLGFRGEYIIFDLPEFCALQQFFLESVGVPVNHSQGGPGTRCVSDFGDLERRLTVSSDWLLVALWSLSETPLSLRERLLGDGLRWKAYLLSYQERFGEVDNVAFFLAYMQRQQQIQWTPTAIPHLPENYYAFGVRNNVRSMVETL